MIGDGLNDAGAIKESTVGISISDDIYGFLPSCDAILEAHEFSKLNGLLRFSRQMKKLVVGGFVISFLYNLIGLSFAIQGLLSPVLAAVLMPLSSITVVAFATFSTNLAARNNKIF
jgi:Cu+-exporting ATPase